VCSVTLGQKDQGEIVSQEFSGPFFVAVGVHTSGVGLAQNVGFTTSAANFVIAIGTNDTYPGRFVVGIRAYVTGHFVEEGG
jgi:hypothetical protein